MMEAGQASFIPRDALLQLMRHHREVAVAVGQQLSAVYYTAHDEVRTLGLTTDPGERLAKLLLSWTMNVRQNDRCNEPLPVKLSLNHEEIGQTIGATRQTVTRLFAEFRRRQILQLSRSDLRIQDLICSASKEVVLDGRHGIQFWHMKHITNSVTYAPINTLESVGEWIASLVISSIAIGMSLAIVCFLLSPAE